MTPRVALLLTLPFAAAVFLEASVPEAAGLVQRARVSPHESTGAVVDGANITIVYGRPSIRGRKIFGRLVPYGPVWCPGADEATVLDSSMKLRIGDLPIPAGPHIVWMLPTPDRWTFIVSQDPSGFHTRYFPDRDLGRVEMKRVDLESPVEQLTFEVKDTPGDGGTIVMSWENTQVSVPFVVEP